MRTFAILAFLVACGSDSVPPTDPPPTEPVYFGQVQKIINENCVDCHSTSPDRLAPFSLATYEDVMAVVDAETPIAFYLMNRMMPPFYAQQDGDCHTFDNAWLDDAELTTFLDWLDGAHLAGDPANSIAPPPPPGGLAEADRRLDIGIDYTPDTSVPDDFQCFVVDAIGTDQFLVGAHIQPSNLTVAHHVVLFALGSAEVEADVLRQQTEAGGGSYRCDGGPSKLGGTFLIGWIPGNQATVFPAGTGLRMDGSRKMVIQMHYNNANSDGRPDRTVIDLDLEPTVATPAQIVQLNGTVDLPPRDPDATATGTLKIPGTGSGKLWGGVVHMHQRGTGSRLEIEGSSNAQCLMDLVNWSFHWQHFYWYEEPVEVRGGDTVRLTCHYDTSNDNQRVGFCEGTECEMCIQFAYVTSN